MKKFKKEGAECWRQEAHKMNGFSSCSSSSATTVALNTSRPFRRIPLNRIFSLVYACGILALLYHHMHALSVSLIKATATLTSFSTSLFLLIADLVLTAIWITLFSFRYRPIRRTVSIPNLEISVNTNDYPKLDVFICTADPYKEPPMGVVNTALSVMAYDYPSEKISVYISDDGGSSLTLFAFMEAAKFAKHWLPFCKKNSLLDRNPEVYFGSNNNNNQNTSVLQHEAQKLKAMYKAMKVRVESVVERGKVGDEYISDEHERIAFSKWTDKCTRQDHPTFIEVLLDSSKDEDATRLLMPNLVYVSREKSKTTPHNYKAGALNVLMRVSAAMSNAPILLALDCDMYSNDPEAPKRVLCFHFDPKLKPTLGYVQFPQRFQGVNNSDIYGCEYKRIFQIHPYGFDGLQGPNHCGTNCFFTRRAFFGGPSSSVMPEMPQLSPDYVPDDKHSQSKSVLELAHHVAACNYEKGTEWGIKMGFRYGTIVEDYYTGHRLQCEGWKSVFCSPERPAFLGDVPMNLADMLGQNKRWSLGLLEVAVDQYSPFTHGTKTTSLLQGLGTGWACLWALYSIPVTIYAFLPQLTLLNRISIFPRVSDPWFLVYAFLFFGAYAQDFVEFILEGSTYAKWWNNQRMWMLRGLSGNLFGLTDVVLKCVGLSAIGFNVTSKVQDEEQLKRYKQGVYDFGVYSPMFVPFTTAAIINVVALTRGLIDCWIGNDPMEGLVVQMFLAAFGVLNSLPIYEAILLRSDNGRIPAKVTLISTVSALGLYAAASCFFSSQAAVR